MIILGIFILKLLQSNLVQSKLIPILKSVQSTTGLNEVILLLLFLFIPIVLVNKITNVYFPMAFILLFIFIGIIIVLFNLFESKFKREYIGFSLISCIIMFTAVISPSFAQILNLTRFYQITFMFLAPFCVIGGIKIYEAIFRTLNFSKEDYSEISLKVFSMFLVIFLFFNTSLTNKLHYLNYTNETIIVFLFPFLAIGIFMIPKLFLDLISPAQKRLKLSKILNISLLIFLIISIVFAFNSGSTNAGGININGHDAFNTTFIPQEYSSATWLSDTRTSGHIYADNYGVLLMQRFYGNFFNDQQIVFGINNTIQIRNNSYIYVRHSNIIHNTVTN